MTKPGSALAVERRLVAFFRLEGEAVRLDVSRGEPGRDLLDAVGVVDPGYAAHALLGLRACAGVNFDGASDEHRVDEDATVVDSR